MNGAPIEIAPSLLSADFAFLGRDIALLESAGCRVLHLDVMDGHYVPNITIGPAVVSAVRRVSKSELDTHLMIEDPGRFLEAFRAAGSDQLTIHYEIAGDCRKVLSKIRASGMSPGISLKPGTPVEEIGGLLDLVDLVLVMSVEPGFGGQEFIPESLERIRTLKGMVAKTGREILISADGGINLRTAAAAAAAGAARLVAGSAVFRGDPAANYRALLAAAGGQAIYM